MIFFSSNQTWIPDNYPSKITKIDVQQVIPREVVVHGCIHKCLSEIFCMSYHKPGILEILLLLLLLLLVSLVCNICDSLYMLR